MMKIMLDAHNLGLKEPTGIGVYAYNLAYCLKSMGHAVAVLYAIHKGNKKSSNNISFFQKLAVEGEVSSLNLLHLIYYGLPYFLSSLTKLGIRPKAVNTDFKISLNGFHQLPPDIAIYNLPYFFRISQGFSAIIKKSTALGLPTDMNRLDVFHATIPLPISKRKFKKVVTLHDLIPLKLPQSTNINLSYYLTIIKDSVKDADIIFTVSEQTKQDAIEILGLKEEKVHVTYQMSYIPSIIKNASQDEVKPILEHYKLVRRKYFIYYGAIEPKKNILRLLQAFIVANTDCKLVILGKNGWLFDQEENFFKNLRYNQSDSDRDNSKIIRIPYSNFLIVMYLLKGARALIFPSLYEGFGLPVLEAMQVGTPVITSHVGGLPEVAGGAAHYIDPYSIIDIKNAIEKYSGNEKFLDQMRVSGINQAEKFKESEYKKRLSIGYEALFK